MRSLFTYASAWGVALGLAWGMALAAAAPVEAQNGGQPALESHEAGGGLMSSHPEPMDPKGGTVLVKLVPVSSALPDADGHAVFNYLKSQDLYVVQVNVRGLLPQTWYQVHLAVASVEERADVGMFRTDTDGDGRAHLKVGEIPSFNIVNIRRPNVSGSRVLTSWVEDGGSLERTPSRRLR